MILPMFIQNILEFILPPPIDMRELFLENYRKKIDVDKKLTQSEIGAISKFLDLYEASKSDFTKPQWAYIFATVFHETNGTFLPVKEAYWLSETWRKNNLRYFPFYGRGYVQITWEGNYRKFSNILGVDFVKYPDKVMEVGNAFFILTYGFMHGSFTGKKISDYINDNFKEYEGARRCINGTDKASMIANYARIFEEIL